MKKKSLLIILTLSVIGLILAIPFDLSISQFLFNQNNLLGRFGEAVGEVPGILVGVFGCAAARKKCHACGQPTKYHPARHE